ncbi:MAG: carbohydrate ABC transporter permease [Firmicutes bacterium]|nr:carbohydrate ABC transporter permease [Bacillota bacterium]
MKIKRNTRIKRKALSVQLIGGLIIGVFTILALYPFLLLIAGSVTSEAEIYKHGFSLFPRELSFRAYETLLRSPQKIINAYGITILITCLGTALGLAVTSMTAYVLACKDFKYAEKFAFFFYFTTLFSGGLVAYYILLVRYLHFKNTIFVLFVPQCLSVFNILIMRNFIKSIPHELRESAKIDGANEFTIYLRLYLPLMGPSFACIGLFLALGYWNNWSAAMLYIDNDKLYPLQYLLYQMTSNVNFLANATAGSGVPMPEMPQQSIKLAMTVITIGPIILAYPFVQKYFVQGITVGSVKG